MQYATEFEMEKVKTTIKQFYRDWSVEVRRGVVWRWTVEVRRCGVEVEC